MYLNKLTGYGKSTMSWMSCPKWTYQRHPRGSRQSKIKVLV